MARRCLRLVEVARQGGSEDDATVLVIHRQSGPRQRLLRYAAAFAAALIAAMLVLAWKSVS
jgi:hypothetical protein